MNPTSSSTTSTDEDPYKVLTQGMRAVEGSLKGLLRTHDEFMIQNVRIVNNLSSMSKLSEEIDSAKAKSKENNRSS
ncbi:uncharacterized protein J8A68_004524 [[Candida] subhashii]|uniref:Uncharacterized protein n=1 Tax=[Candida] subhashii TaxID=561895 RepID=A0A8J5UKE9_9ASCO|nr:uncharacterized protein J8A68_004524 [[Candida] subhashii]KAG7661921.1 hypothetical protein J8A68_004524 [[Candida] subhashii]